MIEATAYILIGGKSSRFGSEKWKARLSSHIILDDIWKACSDFKERKLVGKKKAEKLDKDFIQDLHDINAPIVGLQTAIIASQTNWILLLSCDLPLINRKVLKIIWDKRELEIEAVIPYSKNQLHPLCAIYNIKILDKLNFFISKKSFSMKHLIKNIKSKIINMDHYDRAFFNMNTQEDYNKIKQLYSK
tara:strand:+ start:618 stop:1184 length:567 start_codon:yes stop_codon:yes gene_type:complete